MISNTPFKVDLSSLEGLEGEELNTEFRRLHAPADFSASLMHLVTEKITTPEIAQEILKTIGLDKHGNPTR